MSARQAEKERLIAQRHLLQQCFGMLAVDDLAPETVLRHCREVVRFRARSVHELREISFP